MQYTEEDQKSGNQSKAPDNKLPGQNSPGQKPPDNKPPRIIERIIVKYAVDANLYRLGSTNPKKKSSPCLFSGFYTGAYCRGAFVRVTFVWGLYVGGLLSLIEDRNDRL